MAGPGIRYRWFATELARRFDVTLAIPYATDLELPGVDVVVRGDTGERSFRRWAAGFDAIVAQQLGLRTMASLARTDTRTVYDLYVPYAMEHLGLHGGESTERGRRLLEYQGMNLIQETALATGDAFVCASERQRDLWLGALAALGRIDFEQYERDPTLRALVDVVPFGVEPEPPRHTKQVLKGVVPGIRESDVVLLWGGGIWNWFDPLTLIRAVGRIAERRDDVKLFFLGVRHPNPLIEEMAMAAQAVALADELGLAGRHVFFNEGWVPYEERQNYLLEADLGVSTHFDNVETRFSFRTRVLDYLWAGLPIVTTRGDVLSELVERRGLGRTAEVEDVDGLLAAILELLEDEGARAAARDRIAEVRDEFAWPRVVDRLGELIAAPRLARRAGRSVLPALATQHAVLAGRALAERGVLGAAGDVAGMFRRARRGRRVRR